MSFSSPKLVLNLASRTLFVSEVGGGGRGVFLPPTKLVLNLASRTIFMSEVGGGWEVLLLPQIEINLGEAGRGYLYMVLSITP